VFKYPLNPYQKMTFISAVALCLLCIAWEWFIAPLRPHGSMMVLKCLPLVFVLPGLYRGSNYQMQATSMLILLYFFEGFARLFDPGINPILASIEIGLCSVIFFAVLKHLGPIKKEALAKKEALEAAQAAKEPLG
jgi:uncharacterized membrane protein